MTDKQTQSTTDYEMFKTVKGNRAIHKPHLYRLINSIKWKDMLAENPIIVNKDFEVIDGQHRILAAKALGLPISYIVSGEANLSEVQLLNANNRPWLTVDYLNSYIERGNKEYIHIKEFADEYRLSISIAVRILGGTLRSDGVLLRNFREGKFEIKNLEEAQNLASLISEVRKHSPDYAATHRHCIVALRVLMDKVDPKLFTNQLERYQIIVTRRTSSKDYLRQFENILNSGREGKPILLA